MSYLKGLPLPQPHVDYEQFWLGCREHKLVIQRCTDCGWYRHYPRPVCPKCQSWNSGWSQVSGKGKIWSWTVIHQALDPAVADQLPYNLVEIELIEQDGLRLTSNLINCKSDEIEIGMPVEVVFEEINSDILLPRFKLSNQK